MIIKNVGNDDLVVPLIWAISESPLNYPDGQGATAFRNW